MSKRFCKFSSTVSTSIYLLKLFFQFENDESPVRIDFNLYDDVVPKTHRTFVNSLQSGEHGFGYKNHIFHRVIPQFMLQGGDFIKHNGIGGKSNYG